MILELTSYPHFARSCIVRFRPLLQNVLHFLVEGVFGDVEQKFEIRFWMEATQDEVCVSQKGSKICQNEN